MKLQLIRNATQLLQVNGQTLMIDPMLAPKGSYPAIPGTGNDIPNPVCDLPFDPKECNRLIAGTDALLLTHLHRDHWDTTAQQLFRKDIPLFCQPGDSASIMQAGFTHVTEISDHLSWKGITIHRTGGRHGTGETGKRMGQVSGYVIVHEQQRLYLAGDTIWCDEVKQALDQYHPTQIVVNGGAARFTTGDPIVMSIEDIVALCGYYPGAPVYVVHLEAVNHSTESRKQIRQAMVAAAGLANRCFVPDDGAVFIG